MDRGISKSKRKQCQYLFSERLSYRELFDHVSIFYKDDNELLQITTEQIKMWPDKSSKTESNFLTDLDWHIMGKRYDQVFKSLVNESN